MSCLVNNLINESISLSVMSDSAIPWSIAFQAPLSVEFSRQEYWSGLPFPSPNQKTTVGEIIVTEENGGIEEK